MMNLIMVITRAVYWTPFHMSHAKTYMSTRTIFQLNASKNFSCLVQILQN